MITCALPIFHAAADGTRRSAAEQSFLAMCVSLALPTGLTVLQLTTTSTSCEAWLLADEETLADRWCAKQLPKAVGEVNDWLQAVHALVAQSAADALTVCHCVQATPDQVDSLLPVKRDPRRIEQQMADPEGVPRPTVFHATLHQLGGPAAKGEASSASQAG